MGSMMTFLALSRMMKAAFAAAMAACAAAAANAAG